MSRMIGDLVCFWATDWEGSAGWTHHTELPATDKPVRVNGTLVKETTHSVTIATSWDHANGNSHSPLTVPKDAITHWVAVEPIDDPEDDDDED